jgi:hypothetical protein
MYCGSGSGAVVGIGSGFEPDQDPGPKKIQIRVRREIGSGSGPKFLNTVQYRNTINLRTFGMEPLVPKITAFTISRGLYNNSHGFYNH